MRFDFTGTGATETERQNNCAITQSAPAPDVVVLGTCDSGDYVTRKCENNDRCFTRSCSILAGSSDGECVPWRSPPPARVRTESGGLNVAKDRLKQIFAKSYGFKIWDPVARTQSLGEYRDFTDSDYDESQRNMIDITSKTDSTIPASDWPKAPEVWPITDCRGEECRPLTEVGRTPIQGITINGVSGFGFTGTGVTEPINVVGYGGELRTALQFFGTADKNAGPLTDVNIKWGDKDDGTDVVPHSGRYKNHLGLDACDNSDFAHSTDACTDQYFSFTHTYTCSSSASSTKHACASDFDTNCFATVCPEDVNGAVAGNGSCCVFKPRVQLKDNWGWCNGTCPGPPGPTSNGCYLEECITTTDVDGKYQWTDFAGKVIVVPKD